MHRGNTFIDLEAIAKLSRSANRGSTSHNQVSEFILESLIRNFQTVARESIEGYTFQSGNIFANLEYGIHTSDFNTDLAPTNEVESTDF